MHIRVCVCWYVYTCTVHVCYNVMCVCTLVCIVYMLSLSLSLYVTDSLYFELCLLVL